MSLVEGTRLGPYEITAAIGAGGMGEVFRATDTRLGRDVAIKVLPAVFAQDAERVARFRREAQVLASLNHPGIAAIYGIEETDGVIALALELVDGEDLAQRLLRGPIAVDEAVVLAKQIADALEAAHEKGIVHRDLKPANIKLTPDGKVKVLDFGLAKAYAGNTASGSSADLSNSPTLARTGTEAGLILGTAAYMSPEQARGKTVDKRADIWAFGVVLFEMLTGKQLFMRETVSDTLAAVLKEEVPWSRLPAATPRSVARLVQRCLTREPHERLRDIGDARLELGHGDTASSDASVPTWKQRIAIPAMCIAILAIVAAVFAWMRLASPPSPMALSLEAVLEPGAAVRVVSGLGLALSPQGDRLAFVGAGDDGRAAIWVRPLEGRDATMAPGTTNGVWPFWSPDGHRLGFSAGGKMLTLDLGSGTTRTLCPTNSDVPRGTWSSSDVILFPHDGVIYRADPRGSECRPVTKGGEGQRAHLDPAFFPDGRRFVFAGGGGRNDLYVGDFETGEQTRWMENAVSPQVVAPDRVVFTKLPLGSADLPPLLVQRFDPRTLDLHGSPALLLPRVVTPWGQASFSAAANGVLVAVDDSDDLRSLVWSGPSGQVTGTVPKQGDTWSFAVSRDGRQIALGGFGMRLYDLERGVSTPIPVEEQPPQVTRFPAWSRDDAQLAFQSSFPGPPELRVYRLRDGQKKTLFTSPGRTMQGAAWSPDDTEIAFWRMSGQGADQSEVWVYSLATEKARMLFASTAAAPEIDERNLEFSSAGRGLAYWSSESGAPEVYLRPYPDAGSSRQISSRGGYDPRWSADGKTLYYAAPSGAILSVAVGPAPDYRLGAPQQVRDPSTGSSLYGVSNDGTRFLRRQPGSASPPLRVITNWQARAARAMSDPGKR